MSIISTVPKGAAVEGINPNLLDNWYFLNPVNQRGATTGSIGYCINRWNASYGSGGVTWSLTSSGLSFQPNNSSSYAYISQYIESAVLTELIGKTICVFALTSNGDLFGGRVSYAADITVYNDTYSGHRVQIRFVGNELRFESYTSALTLVAVKFELGDLQTLAHQENGSWVLNEIPDYEYELYRCMTSTADSTDTYANKTLATEQQLAYVETGTTASRNYAVGEYFCWNGLLYRAKTAISSGDTFTIETNCEQTYAAVPSCHLYSVTFNCDSSGRHVFSDGDLPHRAVSSPAGCLARDSSNTYINTGSFDINPRYITAGTFASSSCANKEVTLFFVVYN